MKLVNVGKDTGMLRFLAKDFRFRTKRYLFVVCTDNRRAAAAVAAAADGRRRRPLRAHGGQRPSKRIDIIYRTKPKMIQAYVTTLQQQGTIEFHIDLLQHTSSSNGRWQKIL